MHVAAYQQSKLVQVTHARAHTDVATHQRSNFMQRMMTRAMSMRLHVLGVTINCCHPGVATTELLKTLGGVQKGWISTDEAAETPVRAAPRLLGERFMTFTRPLRDRYATV
jgi:NAD(P)-dependent dehydrogenase (short-subunit alcohol dehydrogenase family)